MPGWTTAGAPVVGSASYPQMLGYERASFDTETAGGSQPQTVGAPTFFAAALYFAMSNSAASALAGAATLNTVAGTITSEALTTAAGANYTLTLTDSAITAASVVLAAAYLKSSTTGGPLVVQSITPAAGSVVIVVKNAGSVALNGTIAILFQAANAV